MVRRSANTAASLSTSWLTMRFSARRIDANREIEIETDPHSRSPGCLCGVVELARGNPLQVLVIVMTTVNRFSSESKRSDAFSLRGAG